MRSIRIIYSFPIPRPASSQRPTPEPDVTLLWMNLDKPIKSSEFLSMVLVVTVPLSAHRRSAN